MELPTEKQRLKDCQLDIRDTVRAIAEHAEDLSRLKIPGIHSLIVELNAAQELLNQIVRDGITDERLRILECCTRELVEQLEQKRVRRYVC